jgi:hypothetical protein
VIAARQEQADGVSPPWNVLTLSISASEPFCAAFLQRFRLDQDQSGNQSRAAQDLGLTMRWFCYRLRLTVSLRSRLPAQVDDLLPHGDKSYATVQENLTSLEVS